MIFKYRSLIFLFVLFSACKKETINSSVEISGHAGFGLNSSTSVYSENSLEAIKLCIETIGTSGVEVDIQFSKNGTAWCFHDQDLSLETNSSGNVSEKSDIELQQVEYKLDKLKLCKLTQLPTDLWGKQLFFDIREFNYLTNQYQKEEVIDQFISSCLVRFPKTKLIAIVGTDLFVQKFKAAGFEVYLDYVDIQSFKNFSLFSELTGLSISSKLITKDEIEEIHSLEKKVLIFDARSPKFIREALKKGADIFLADNINATLIEKYK